MSKKTIQQILEEMTPQKALKEMAAAMKKLFPLLDEKTRLQFVMELIGDTEKDKVSSLVHL